LKEVLDIAVWIGFAFILFIFLRGMNETQVEKHEKKLEEIEEKNLAKKEKEKIDD